MKTKSTGHYFIYRKTPIKKCIKCGVSTYSAVKGKLPCFGRIHVPENEEYLLNNHSWSVNGVVCSDSRKK